jgi:hypothetical protein
MMWWQGGGGGEEFLTNFNKKIFESGSFEYWAVDIRIMLNISK